MTCCRRLWDNPQCTAVYKEALVKIELYDESLYLQLKVAVPKISYYIFIPSDNFNIVVAVSRTL